MAEQKDVENMYKLMFNLLSVLTFSVDIIMI